MKHNFSHWYWNYHSNLINLLLINQPLVAAINMISRTLTFHLSFFGLPSFSFLMAGSFLMDFLMAGQLLSSPGEYLYSSDYLFSQTECKHWHQSLYALMKLSSTKTVQLAGNNLKFVMIFSKKHVKENICNLKLFKIGLK